MSPKPKYPWEVFKNSLCQTLAQQTGRSGANLLEKRAIEEIRNLAKKQYLETFRGGGISVGTEFGNDLQSFRAIPLLLINSEGLRENIVNAERISKKRILLTGAAENKQLGSGCAFIAIRAFKKSGQTDFFTLFYGKSRTYSDNAARG